MTYYNGERFVSEQLNSLEKQMKYINELIISDDHSLDEQYLILFDNVSKIELKKKAYILRNSKNLGYANNFFSVINKSTCKYVFLCDQDDIWNESKIRDMVAVMESNDDINLLCCDLQPVYSDNNAPKWDRKNLADMKNDGSIERCNDIKRNHHLRRSGCTMCVRRSFFEQVKPYWVDGWAHDDFLWKMSVYSKSCAILHKILIQRRLHSDNASEIKVRTLDWRIKELESMKLQHEMLLRYCNNQNIGSTFTDVICHNIDALKLRLRFLHSRNIFLWFLIIQKYRDTYTGRWKGILLDLFLTIFNEYKRRK